ncbi:rod shape-determining protein MreC [Negadavirga shengliensis]|uniref:Cell shape-determining protein MreC n=1 Tax=Negadavirga shengliensis TaxID=1389218 RepID=A0ABV9SUW0_9BACT
MQRILIFLYKIRAFLLFIALESVAIWMVVTHNSPQGAVFFNSSNRLTGSLLERKTNFLEYFYLKSVNEALSEKNASLMKRIEEMKVPADTALMDLDANFQSGFDFWSAKVINNSIHLNQNHITLNKGRKQGIRVGMGVFNEQGVIGRVKGVTDNFSSVLSLLHTDLLLSSKIKRTKVFGSTKWDGVNPQMAKLLYVPRHVQIVEGDTVVTSGYNAVFPEDIPIGWIKEVKQGEETNYLDITIQLSTDFTRLSYVYLVENPLRQELDSLNLENGNVNP